MVARQLGLLEPTSSGFDAGFSRIKRSQLVYRAWVDYAQGWLGDHAALFESLLQEAM